MTQKHHLKTALTTTSPPTHSEVLLSLRPLSLWINFKLLNPVSIFSLLTSKRLQKSSNWSIFYKPFHTMFSCQSSNTVWIPLFKSLHWVPTVLKKKKKKARTLVSASLGRCSTTWLLHISTILPTLTKWILFSATKTPYVFLCLCFPLPCPSCLFL